MRSRVAGLVRTARHWAFAGGLSLSCSTVRADLWSTAYYAAWLQDYMPASNVDFRAVTHVIHFAVMPRPDGSLDAAVNGVTPAHAEDVVSRAHAAGAKALICVGGADSQAGFQDATAAAHRGAFVSNLLGFVSTFGYDGVDVDWEPLDAGDAPQYTNFVGALRTALTAFSPQSLLTAAAAAQPALFAAIQDQFDQINLMTYDLSGPWPGWITWFNSPIYDGGARFPSTGELVPSTDGMVNGFLAAGVVPGKLGIGLPFYAVVWSGGSGTSTGGAALPRQTWSAAPRVASISYDEAMTRYDQAHHYHWDTNAQAAYLSMDDSGSTNDAFVSYDDEHACQAKVSYARNRGLGGVMMFDLGNGYRAGLPLGQRDPLLQAVKQALATPRFTGVNVAGQDVELRFTSLPLASYRVLWTSNLAAGAWNTLTNDVAGSGGVLPCVDPAAVGQSERFYRVRTPP